jgi:hypothetical protein
MRKSEKLTLKDLRQRCVHPHYRCAYLDDEAEGEVVFTFDKVFTALLNGLKSEIPTKPAKAQRV